MAAMSAAPADSAPVRWAAVLPGDIVLVWYSDVNVFHDRYWLWLFGWECWIIVTHDGDTSLENIGSFNPWGTNFGVACRPCQDLPVVLRWCIYSTGSRRMAMSRGMRKPGFNYKEIVTVLIRHAVGI